MTKEEFEKQLDGMAFNGENLGKFLRENYSLSVPTTITEDMTNGIDEGIRCAMCTNPMANNRGCDGMCKVDKTMYRKVLDVINNTLYKGNFTMPKTDCTDAISRELAIKHLTKARMLGDSRPMEDIFAEIPSVNPTTDLSKIRAEIAQKALEPDYQHDCEDWHVGLIMAEEIIDKYSKGGE